jgi:hypothetical protein
VAEPGAAAPFSPRRARGGHHQRRQHDCRELLAPGETSEARLRGAWCDCFAPRCDRA